MAEFLSEKRLFEQFLEYVPAQCAYKVDNAAWAVELEAKEFLSMFADGELSPQITPARLVTYFMSHYID